MTGAAGADTGALVFPHPAPPVRGETIEIAPGVLWARAPLPFRLNHVNIYILEDGDGWAVIDPGIADDASRAVWEVLLAGPLRGRKLTRLIVTHAHPDHIGLAGWLVDRFGVPLLTSRAAYFECLTTSLDPGRLEAKVYTDFYRRNGVDAKTTAILSTLGHGYLRMIAPLPTTYQRLAAGDRLRIGAREFCVLSGDGHASEQLMLHCPEDGLFFAADQVLARISPNVSVSPVEPDGDPLGLYLRSLRALRQSVPADALTLPGHDLPFVGLHARLDALIAHHKARCDALIGACRAQPRASSELLGVLFTRELDPHEMGFAFNELLAHINYLLRRGVLRMDDPSARVTRFTVA